MATIGGKKNYNPAVDIDLYSTIQNVLPGLVERIFWDHTWHHLEIGRTFCDLTWHLKVHSWTILKMLKKTGIVASLDGTWVKFLLK